MRRMLITAVIALTLLGNIPNVVVGQAPAHTSIYYPPPGDNWQRKPAADLGVDAAVLE